MNFRVTPDAIKRRREAAGMTAEAVARNAGLTARTVRSLEAGERDTAHEATIVRLAFALGCAPEDIAPHYRPAPFMPGFDPSRFAPPDPLAYRPTDPARAVPRLPFVTAKEFCLHPEVYDD